MKKLKDLILRHKLLSSICLLAFIIIIIMMYVFFNLFVGGNNKYGNRLDGIKSHEVSSSEKNDIVSSLKENEAVSDASVRIQGKIIYFDIYYVKGTSTDRAKEIANTTKEEFSDEEKSFYDLEYVLVEDKGDNKEEETFVVTGTKNSSLEEITWSRN